MVLHCARDEERRFGDRKGQCLRWFIVRETSLDAVALDGSGVTVRERHIRSDRVA